MKFLMLRDELSWFAQEMEEVLRANDHKGGWEDDTLDELFTRLLEEVSELHKSLHTLPRDRVVKEAADVANFAMMIASVKKGYTVK